jgi:5-methylcytosine-specific restriction endonuclease McrA
MGDPYKRSAYRRNRLVVLEQANHRCCWPGCSQPATTADHIVPLVAGGGHDLDNLRAMCAHHNSVGGAAITNQKRQARKIGRRSRGW